MKKLLVICIAVATLMLMPAIVVGQIVVNADIWYDEASNTVYGYNEAYTTYELDFYYEAQVSAQIYANGEFLDDTLVVSSGSYAIALVSVPGEPNTDYTLYGNIYGCMYYWQLIYPYYYYYDFFNFAYRIQYDPCFGFRCVMCDGPGPPTWILMVACGGFVGVVHAIHVGPPFCTPPTGEETSFKEWLITFPEPGVRVEGGRYEMTLIGVSDYTGKKVSEGFANSLDTCKLSYPNSPYDRQGFPQETKDWDVIPGNIWKSDYLAINKEWMDYYSANISISSCVWQYFQHMWIEGCGTPSGWWEPYGTGGDNVVKVYRQSPLRKSVRHGVEGTNE